MLNINIYILILCIYIIYIIYIYTHIQVSRMLKIKVDTLQTSRDAILEPHCCEMMVDKAEYQGNNWA